MAAMFEKDEAGFIEAFDPNAEPGVIAAEDSAGTTDAAAETDEETA